MISKPKYVINNFVGLFQNTETIYLDIKFKDFEKLRVKRDQALKIGILESSDDDFVDAIIRYSDKKLKAKVRLKGDYTDHLLANKWSYRVKINDGKTINGLNKFSLHSPRTRNYLYEWLFHKLLKLEGLPSLKYEFLRLNVNGDDLGIYAIEQHFDKILLESNNFKEGPIVKLSESNLWSRRAKTRDGLFPDIGEKMFFQTEPEFFKKKRTLSNTLYLNQAQDALGLLGGFYEGKLSTSEAFEIKLLAKYFAITDLLNASHSRIWHNQRYYFDPVLTKLIPIGFDGFPGETLKTLSLQKSSEEVEAFGSQLNFFSDYRLVKEYIKNLERVSQRSYLDDFFQNYKEDYTRQQKILYKSFPTRDLNKEILYQNQRIIQNFLTPKKPLNIYLQEFDKDKLVFSIGNKQQIPIEIISIKKGNLEIYRPVKQLLIKPKEDSKFIQYSNLEIPLNQRTFSKINSQNKNLIFEYSLLGSETIKQSSVFEYERIDIFDTKNDLIRLETDLSKYKFLNIKKDHKIILIKPGRWIIKEPLVFPEGYKIKAGPGVVLNLTEKGFIYSKSPLEFIGNKEDIVNWKK